MPIPLSRPSCGVIGFAWVRAALFDRSLGVVHDSLDHETVCSNSRTPPKSAVEIGSMPYLAATSLTYFCFQVLLEFDVSATGEEGDLLPFKDVPVRFQEPLSLLRPAAGHYAAADDYQFIRVNILFLFGAESRTLTVCSRSSRLSFCPIT